MTIEQFAIDNALTMQARFIPFSQSKRAKLNPKLSDLSLNWEVTLLVGGKPIITTDYWQGVGHAPSYKQGKPTLAQFYLVQRECEQGKALKCGYSGVPLSYGKTLQPKLSEVLSCLIADASALDFASFEEWAACYGYDTDSRKAEGIYRACLSNGLRLRNGLGAKAFDELQQFINEG